MAGEDPPLGAAPGAGRRHGLETHLVHQAAAHARPAAELVALGAVEARRVLAGRELLRLHPLADQHLVADARVVAFYV